MVWVADADSRAEREQIPYILFFILTMIHRKNVYSKTKHVPSITIGNSKIVAGKARPLLVDVHFSNDGD